MKLQKITIKNFRGLKGENNTIDFSNSNIIFLIGQNNVGKSTYLRAYEFFVNPSVEVKRLHDNRPILLRFYHLLPIEVCFELLCKRQWFVRLTGYNRCWWRKYPLFVDKKRAPTNGFRGFFQAIPWNSSWKTLIWTVHHSVQNLW